MDVRDRLNDEEKDISTSLGPNRLLLVCCRIERAFVHKETSQSSFVR